MKHKRILIIVLVVFLSIPLIYLGGLLLFTKLIYGDNYSGLKDTKDAVLVYDGNEYESAFSWHPKNLDNYTVTTGVWQGYEHPIRVFDDPQKRFIVDEFFNTTAYFHRKDDVLPDFRNTQEVEKIFISFVRTPADHVLIENGEPMMTQVVELMSQQYQKDVFKNNSPFEKNVAKITVYFYDYPATYSAASVIQAKDGSYGIRMNDLDASRRGKRDYIPIPADSPVMQYLEAS